MFVSCSAGTVVGGGVVAIQGATACRRRGAEGDAGGRLVSGVITGIDGVEIDGMGTVTGRRVGRGDTPANSVGTLLAGRVASEANLRVCARFWLRADIGEFEYLPDGSGWYDRATGQAYEVLDSDPLFADRPDELATLFSVQGDRIVFLRRREGVTVQTVERDQAKRAREVEAEAERERKFRERQPKTPMLLHERYGERFEITVREAARQLLDAEGTIKRGTHGELDVRIPGRLTGDAVSEHGARQQLLNAAEVLIAGSKVVLAEIERAEGERAARKQRPTRGFPISPSRSAVACESRSRQDTPARPQHGPDVRRVP